MRRFGAEGCGNGREWGWADVDRVWKSAVSIRHGTLRIFSNTDNYHVEESSLLQLSGSMLLLMNSL